MVGVMMVVVNGSATMVPDNAVFQKTLRQREKKSKTMEKQKEEEETKNLH